MKTCITKALKRKTLGTHISTNQALQFWTRSTAPFKLEETNNLLLSVLKTKWDIKMFLDTIIATRIS